MRLRLVDIEERRYFTVVGERRLSLSVIRTVIIMVFAIALLLTISAVTDSVEAQGQSYTWTQPVMLSTNSASSWFPDMAIDNQGRVHVVWETHLEGWERRSGSGVEVVHSAMHIVRDNGSWSEPNDVFSQWSPAGVIFRLALAADYFGHTYMTVKPGNEVLYMKSASDASASALAWSEPVPLGGAVAYISDIATDSKGVIHVIWDQTVPVPGEDGDSFDYLPDIFYRRSEDGGRTWSAPVNLSNSPVGEGRGQIKIDSSDAIYVTWDEGGQGIVLASGTGGTSYRGVLTFSQDGGETWSSPSSFSYPENTNSRIASASNGQGGVLVVWRARTRDSIYYDWSKDWGESWTPPAAIPGILAYSPTPFDAYDMAVDSAGTIHLVATGKLSREDSSRGIYHLAWDGSSWSSPTLIYNSEQRRGQYLQVGMYPKIVVSRGNQLHAVWHTYAEGQPDAEQERYVWYSASQSLASPQPLPPTPTSVSTPTPTSLAGLVSTPTATPMPEVASDPVPPGVLDAIFTENDDVLLMLQSLIPAALIIAAVFVVRRILERR